MKKLYLFCISIIAVLASGVIGMWWYRRPTPDRRPLAVVSRARIEGRASHPPNLKGIGRRAQPKVKPPYIVTSSGPVRFGTFRTLPPSEKILITTRERTGRGHWLKDPVSTIKGLTVHAAGPTDETPMGPGVVSRHYEFLVEFLSLPRVGETRGEVLFFGEGSGNQAVLRLPVLAIVQPPVIAVPSTLYASVNSGQKLEPQIVMVKCGDPDFDLHLTPTEETLSIFEVRLRESDPKARTFEVFIRSQPDGTVSRTLTFKTNHPEQKDLRIPYVIRVSGPAS